MKAMPQNQEYRTTVGNDSDPEDWDLDDLDYAIDTTTSSHHGRPGLSSPWQSKPTSSPIPLTTWRPSASGNTWNAARRLHHDTDDLESLLHDDFERERGWNVKKEDRNGRPNAHLRHPSSMRQSLQLLSSMRQEFKDTQEEDQVSNENTREVDVGRTQHKKFPPNIVSNAKYTPWSFLPLTLYNEFRFFLNIYFLLVALSQVIPYLRIGYMSTYIAPLLFVLTISIGKEAIDDIARRRRDAEANAELYTVLAFRQGSPVKEVLKKSRDLKVGDILKLTKTHRVPADLVILKSIQVDQASRREKPEQPGAAETFIRTDQLDGETDWKLRIPCTVSQNIDLSALQKITVTASAPSRAVNQFVGTATYNAEMSYDPHRGKQSQDGPAPDTSTSPSTSVALSVDNTAWANTVLASNTITYAVVIYTGRQTRSALSTAPSRSKIGLLELEINTLTKILCVMTLSLSTILVALEGFEPSNKKPWYVAIMIYLILFSTIIPISLRVNLDLAKSVYARFIERDASIPGSVVRTSTIPEDLGRIEYLLSDKTGTLTQNEMQLKKIHVGTVSYAGEAMEEVADYVNQSIGKASAAPQTPATTGRSRREIGTRVRDLMIALALCHNVTPSVEEVDGKQITSYQASSPDEIAIVEFAESVGLRLHSRTREQITLQSTVTNQVVLEAKILNVFPFTSDLKRMGIVISVTSSVASLEFSEVVFYQKGADTTMSPLCQTNNWLEEETANMAREGLRTLVVARKRLTQSQYDAFAAEYRAASLSLQDREMNMQTVVSHHLEHDLDLLGVTGVEDRLQARVKPSLELLRNAGIKIWMLTGDKPETARCVAISSRLVARSQTIFSIVKLKTAQEASSALDTLSSRLDSALLIDGESLALVLDTAGTSARFISLAVMLPSVIACRCSPTQKAEIALLIRKTTKKRVCCIGDGGNDVSMIQAADVGVGIVGKEGRQASLAADFSITQFHHLTKLLLWHGRNSYKRSAKLAQFIIHRGLIISVCQTMYNIAGHFDPKGLFKDWLLVGYATIYTMAPVFSLVLDRDLDEHLANLYPELYAELKTGRSLSYTSFSTWLAVSIYQGTIIQGLSQLLVNSTDGPRMLSVSFTVLVLNELIMVAVSVTTWHWIMAVCILGTFAVYIASIPFLDRYFDLSYIVTLAWLWRVVLVAGVSLVPVWSGKLIRRAWRPPSYRKVQQGR